MGQQTSTPNPTSPILHVTVIARTTSAVNYHYRFGPTPIDFQGTVLLAKSHGSALVESKPGRTEVDVKLDGLTDPQQFGREYMTYVLWALTPDGRPHNMGELIANGSDKAKLRVSTDLQAFAMIVTAEPYSAVRQPSDVVVMENKLRPDTMGRVQTVNARYELLPRGHYSWQVPEGRSVASTPKVSMKEYEALTEMYQAQNAIGIAREAGAGQYAADTLGKAQALLAEAEQWHSRGKEHARVVQNAREAAQTAEDARLIAERRKQDQQLAEARVANQDAARLTSQAEADRQRAIEAQRAAQAEADAQRIARERVEAELVNARDRAMKAEARAAEAERARAEAESRKSVDYQRQKDSRQKQEGGMKLMADLASILPTLDTPRGLVMTVPDTGFVGDGIRESTASELARVSELLSRCKGIRVDVEGHMDSGNGVDTSWSRAEAVRLALIRRGVPAGAVFAHGLGNSRRLGPNREQNRRVELVITGDPIGSTALWDRTYNLTVR